MLSLVRGGTRGLFLRIEKTSVLEMLRERFSMEEKEQRDALDEAREDQTLLFVSSKEAAGAAPRVFLADVDTGEMLSFLLNSVRCEGIGQVRLLPRTILFRVSGDPAEVIDQVSRDFGAKKGRLKQILRWTGGSGVAVFFTDRNLNRPIGLKDLHKDVLYVEMPFQELFRNLRNRALSYFNQARGHEDWKSLEIRVYDSWERYDLQKKRLRMILEEMEVGLLLGEGWGKDYARILMAVRVYRFHLATFLKPEKIKEILMGLEFSSTGRRLVDLDLFDSGKKVGWGKMAASDENHEQAGARFRRRLLRKLLPSTRKELARIDREMRKEEV